MAGRRWLAGGRDRARRARAHCFVLDLDRLTSHRQGDPHDADSSPFVLQADCSVGKQRLSRAAAVLQTTCAMRQVVALLERLETLGVYDASDIVIAADHGYGFETRSPPISPT